MPEVREGSDGKMYRTKKRSAKPGKAAGQPPQTENADGGADPSATPQKPPAQPRPSKAIERDLSWIEKNSARLRERVVRVLSDFRVGAKPTRDIEPLRALHAELDAAIRAFEVSTAA